jgi:hypothetical protein
VLATLDWTGIGTGVGIVAGAVVVGGAFVRSTRSYITVRQGASARLDRLEIRLFGLPADLKSGARKVDGEFDKIDQRMDRLDGRFDEVLDAVKDRP